MTTTRWPPARTRVRGVRLPIARGVASINWSAVPPGIFDAGEDTVDWSVEVAGTAVVAVVRAAVIGPDPATGIAVQLRSGAISGSGALDADGHATLPLVDAQQRPLTESAAWDHDWTETSVIIGADVCESRETRERVRRWARARLDRPPDDAFLAEILAAESVTNSPHRATVNRRRDVGVSRRRIHCRQPASFPMLSECQTTIASCSGTPETSARARCNRSPTIPGSNWWGVMPGHRRRSAATPASWSAFAPLGVAATNDVDALLALKPDCVVYNPMWIDVDELVRILSAGVNVVTTASFITGHNLGEGRDRIVEACEKGGSTIFGSGVSPGFAELLAIVSAMVCNRVDKVTVNEAADTTFYDSPDTEKPVGFGQPIDHPELQADGGEGHGHLRRGRPAGGRRARRRARRGALRGRVRPDHSRSRNGVLDDPRGMRRGRLRQLAGHRRRQNR